MVGCQSFKGTDGYRLIDFAPPAGVFARVGTDPAKYPRQGQVLHYDLQCLFELALLHHLHITLDVQSCRACQTAGGLVALLDGKGTRYGLGVFFEGSLSFGQTLIIFTWQYDRTHLGTFAARSTSGAVDITRGFTDFDLKISRLTLNRLHIRQGDEVDVQMPADLDQFGGNNSHGAVIGGKGLVQLAHHTTYGSGFFDHMHQEARIRQIQRSLHSSNPATNNHYRSLYVF